MLIVTCHPLRPMLPLFESLHLLLHLPVKMLHLNTLHAMSQLLNPPPEASHASIHPLEPLFDSNGLRVRSTPLNLDLGSIKLSLEPDDPLLILMLFVQGQDVIPLTQNLFLELRSSLSLIHLIFEILEPRDIAGATKPPNSSPQPFLDSLDVLLLPSKLLNLLSVNFWLRVLTAELSPHFPEPVSLLG